MTYNSNNDKRTQFFAKTFFILFGIFFIGSGIGIIQRKELVLKSWTYHGQAAINWGILEILLGLSFIVVVSTLKKNLAYFGQQKNVICSSCFEAARPKGQNSICQKCGGALEDLRDFYDRHPELRDRKQL